MRGCVFERSKGHWAIVIDIGKKPNGDRDQKWHTIHGTKKDADRERARLINEVNTGSYVEPSKLTVGKYLEQWLEDCVKTNTAFRTHERYSEIVRHHIIPGIGNHLLCKLKPTHIQRLYAKALDAGRKDGTGGLSPRSVLGIHRILRAALKQAVELDMLTHNPADRVRPPKVPKKEMQALNEKQVAMLLASLKTSSVYIPVVIAIATGMRRGEILGLRWSDIDLDKCRVTIRRSLQDTKGRGVMFTEPKTAKSRRVVTLPKLAVNVLRNHKEAQEQIASMTEKPFDDQGLVFTRTNGEPISPNYFSGRFRAAIGKIKIPQIRFHDLRHTHATLLFGEDVHPKIVSERLGHSTIGITLDTYSHVLPSMQEGVVDKLDIILSGGDDSIANN